jgi:hypothetical protein
MGHLNLRNILFMFHHIHVKFKFREFGAAASNSCMETINETYVDELTDTVVYQRWHHDDLKVVPYTLQMMMDWDSHINVEYRGSGHCVQCLYKYLFKAPAQKELKCIQSKSMILMMRLYYSYMDRLYMRNGGNVAFLWVSGLSSIYSSCLFFQSANSRAVGCYCEIWQDFGFTSLLQQTNQFRKHQVC